LLNRDVAVGIGISIVSWVEVSVP